MGLSSLAEHGIGGTMHIRGVGVAATTVVVVVLVLVSGCASNSTTSQEGTRSSIGAAIGRPVEPTAPDGAEIDSYLTALGNQRFANTLQYVMAGYAVVDDKCHAFFDALYQAKGNERFVRNEAILTLGTSSAALALATKAAKALAYIALGTSFASSTFDNFENWSYLSLYQVALKDQVKLAMQQYRNNNPPSAAIDAVTADQFVKHYAYLCTPMQMDDYIQNALGATQPSVISGGQQMLEAVETQVGKAVGAPGAIDLTALQTLQADLQGDSAADNSRRAAIAVAPFATGANNPYWGATGQLMDVGKATRTTLNNISSVFGGLDKAATAKQSDLVVVKEVPRQ